MYEKYCKLRDDANLTDYAVAKKTGIGQSTFTDWKKGKSVPKTDKLMKIAEAFGVPLEYFTGNVFKNSTYVLSEDERELLSLYRKIPIEKRVELLDYAQFIQSTLKKTGSSKVG